MTAGCIRLARRSSRPTGRSFLSVSGRAARVKSDKGSVMRRTVELRESIFIPDTILASSTATIPYRSHRRRQLVRSNGDRLRVRPAVANGSSSFRANSSAASTDGIPRTG